MQDSALTSRGVKSILRRVIWNQVPSQVPFFFYLTSKVFFCNSFLVWTSFGSNPVLFVLAKISPNFDLKNMTSTYTKEFPWKKNGPNSSDLEKKQLPNRQIFLMISSSRQPRIQKDSDFFLFSYLLCSQIWLNHLMDDRHFTYITKLEKKKP